MPKTVDLSNPTRRTIEHALRDMMSVPYRGSGYHKLEEQVDAIEKKLLNNSVLKRLKAKRDAARRVHYEREQKLRAEAKIVLMEYRTRGLAPDVKRKLTSLVKLYNTILRAECPNGCEEEDD